MRHPFRAAVAAALAAAAAFVAFGATAGADVTPQADEPPPFAIEDFTYPGAAQIQAERGFLLKRGDGHIVLLDECPVGTTDPDVLLLAARNQPNFSDVCFRVHGNTGHLTLELASVYGVRTGTFSSEVVLSLDDGATTETYDVPPNTYAGVGETDPTVPAGEYALLEITVSR
jgi:hypothetical protein